VLCTKTIIITGAGIAAVAGGQRGSANGNTDPSKPVRSDEQLLTGDTAAKVTAAAQAEEPGATLERVETDSDGVYEAHMVRADGTHIILQVGADFASPTSRSTRAAARAEARGSERRGRRQGRRRADPIRPGRRADVRLLPEGARRARHRSETRGAGGADEAQ
jgi:hypothetical protein